MKSKYPIVMYSQMSLLIIDNIFNIIAMLIINNNSILLMLYILQDTLQVMSALVLLISFTSTFVFQVGLITLVFMPFLPSIIIIFLYILTSICFHYITLNLSWDNPNVSIYRQTSIFAFYVFHRMLSCLYYSFYKYAAMNISQPKYNIDSQWLREEFKKRLQLQTQQSVMTNTADEPRQEEVVHH